MNTWQNKQFRCPLIFTVTGLLALTALGINGEEVPVAITLGVLFLLPYLIKLRLPESSMATWAVRLVVYLVVYQFTKTSDDGSSDLSDPHSVIVMGCLSASEMVLQCWRSKPAGRPPGLSLILFAGIAYLGACYTSEEVIVKWLTPAFFLLLCLSWRRLEAQTLYDPLSRWAKGIYIITLVAAVGIGLGAYWIISDVRGDINMFAQGLLIGSFEPKDAGMSDQPELGSTFGLQGSPERVLLMKGDLSDPHLRALAFEHYVGGTWGPSIGSRHFVGAPTALGVANSEEPSVQVTKLRYASGLIYYPLDASFVSLDQQTGTEWCPADGGPIRSNALSPSTYTFSESPNQSDFLDNPTSTAKLEEDLVVPPSISPAVRTLARKVAGSKMTASAKIQAICAELDADHAYSLTYSAGTGDPISGFILSKKPAHCEYFASAAVILLRCSGIPARYVTGYYAHERDGDGNIIVRQRDAHAWAEAYVNGTWLTVDATPAGGRPDELFGPVSAWEMAIENIQDRIQLLQDEAQQIGPGKIIAVVIGLIVVYLFVRIAWVELRNRRKRTNAADSGGRDLSVYAERFNRLLDKRRIVVPPGETWLEYFEKSVDAPIERVLVLDFINEYYALRFGGGSGARLSELLDQMEQEEKVKETV